MLAGRRRISRFRIPPGPWTTHNSCNASGTVTKGPSTPCFGGTTLSSSASLNRCCGVGAPRRTSFRIELWRRRQLLNADDSCKAYLFRAVRNRVLNAIRHDSNVRRLEPVVRDEAVALEAPAADVSAGANELDVAIREAVSALREPIRECFLLSRRDKLTYAQIAEVLGVSVKTVEARMGAALRELREKLAQWI
jgi:RNA polymerase sigma factor (sigma-70 family)